MRKTNASRILVELATKLKTLNNNGISHTCDHVDWAYLPNETLARQLRLPRISLDQFNICNRVKK
jgi:hypothetical protein